MKRSRFLALLLALACACALAVTPGYAIAGESHSMAFASDRHVEQNEDPNVDPNYNPNSSTHVIQDAMGGTPGMPRDEVEYVCLIGDMPHTWINDTQAPIYTTKPIFDEIVDIGFTRVTSKDNVDVLWARHDASVDDNAGIIFANDGYGSGVMHTGYNSDNSVAYYVYGVAFFEFVDSDKAPAAAQQFEKWVDDIDQSVPIIVCCHVPIHFTWRRDNHGAPAWNDALNYAATGSETPGDGCAVSRNVVFLYGHNHTYEWEENKETHEVLRTGEFYIPCGTQMQVGSTQGVWSPIYYTYVTAGYLKHNTTALLVTIDDDDIVLTKYKNGAALTGSWYDPSSKSSGAFAKAFETNAVNTIARVQKVATNLPDGCSLTFSGGTQVLGSSGTGYLQPGELTATVKPSSNANTVDTFTVTADGQDVAVTKVGFCTYSFTLPQSNSEVTISVTEKPRTSIAGATVGGVKAKYTYTGSAFKPTPTVTLGSSKLASGQDYRVSYANNTKAGTATITIEGIGDYNGKITKKFTIAKAGNTMVVKGKTVKLKYANLKKKAQVIKRTTAISVTNAKGGLSFKKYSGSKNLTVSSAGRVTVKKGLKKGTYKVRVKVTAAGNSNYKALSKIVTVTVAVK